MTATHPPVLLHVGYIKTGTTFLQDSILSQPGSGLALAAGSATRAHTVQNILLADDYQFDATALRAHLEDLAAPIRASGRLPVWSEETLLGNPPTARYDGFSNARKAKAIYPEAKVLITIRRQQEIALSMYREYLRGKGTLPLQSFIGTGQEALAFVPLLRPEFLFYDRAVRHYQELFGADHVLVLPQELLAQDPAAYVAWLAAFTGQDVPSAKAMKPANVAEGDVALGLRRVMNRLIVNDYTSPGRQGIARLSDLAIRGINKFTPRRMNAIHAQRARAMVAARYRGLFVASNRATADLTGLNLGEFGYDI